MRTALPSLMLTVLTITIPSTVNLTLPVAAAPSGTSTRATTLTGLPRLGTDTANVVADTSSPGAADEGSEGVDVGADEAVGVAVAVVDVTVVVGKDFAVDPPDDRVEAHQGGTPAVEGEGA